MRAGGQKRSWAAVIAAVLCALVAGLTLAAVAAAETGSEVVEAPGGRGFPMITSVASPEEYEQRLNLEGLGPTHSIDQVSPAEIVVKDSEGDAVEWFDLEAAHDADGASVPTSLRLEGEEIILTVHHREGNPAAGGAPFTYPITEGPGWEGGYRTIAFEMNEPKPPAAESPAPSPPAPTCTVPSLRGLGLRAAKAKLRVDNCAVGQVHLAHGATRGKGTVVKQFRGAGAQLTAGTPVAIKLGSR